MSKEEKPLLPGAFAGRGKHQWPSDAPPCRTSGAEACARCGLVRKAVPGPSGMRWHWRYSRDGVELSAISGPCIAAKLKLSQVLREVSRAA